MKPTETVRCIYLLLLLTWLEDLVIAKKQHTCPIGFNLAYTTSKTPICYRKKGPEAFEDKFKDCAGNLYTSKLYHSLNLTKTNKVLWTEYKSMYPGGPFIDWSYTKSAGDILVTTYDVKYDASLGIDEELCVVIDPVSNLTATKCEEKHYRYCFVSPYPEQDDMSKDGCDDFRGSWRFFSPSSNCLTPVTGIGGGTVRATWRQAYDLCSKRKGSLLYKGWRYSNSPLLHSSGSYPMYPMGMVMNTDHNELRYDVENNTDEIPVSEWHFESTPSSKDSIYGAIRDDFWHLVNSSFIFFDVICERPAPLRYIDLQLSVDWENKIVLSTNDSIKVNDINCFSDSLLYYPSSIAIRKSDDGSNIFRVDPGRDGYYWCIQVDYKNYHVTESNKALFIRSRESTLNLYACKIYLNKKYNFENLEKQNKVLKKKLEEFIFYSTKYVSVYGEMNTTDMYEAERALKAFKSGKPELDWKGVDVIFSLNIKRIYLDARTVLVHVMVNPDMTPPATGVWDNFRILSMKPAYICKGFDSVPSLPLGESVTSAGCRVYTCVGDYNEGVQWLETAADSCTPSPMEVTQTYRMQDVQHVMPTWVPETTDESDEDVREETINDSTDMRDLSLVSPPRNETDGNSSRPPPPPTPPNLPDETTTDFYEVTTTYETATYTTTQLPPQEQLDQVLEGLENLLLNDTVPLESIVDTFDQVNDILDLQDDEVEIPGQLLHLLDELGSRISLDGEPTAVAVRENIALLLADVTPENPVRGMRVAAREYDGFQNDSFAFIDGEVESDSLLANSSEAVVYLPPSVTRTARRVSFVAFRNQRAFSPRGPPPTEGDPVQVPARVNSRIFSVNVENLTTFENGEVIDIHLSPVIEDPERNQSRVCAYWQFTETGGFWSQDGCELIRGGPGMLDTCRCSHLTHFAEILVPRTVFSERNESALEILSLIGCFLSIFGLLMIALTATLFRSWRRDYSNKIWLQLCIAIFILVVCFVAVSFADFTRYDVTCMLVGVALHYSVLASFCWMLVAAVLSYRRLVLVFTRDMSHKLLRASAFSWGAPCAVVGILLSVDPQSYAGRFEEIAPSGGFCYPSGLSLWLAVYAPVAVMLLVNWTLFALIVRSVFASRRIQRHGDSNEAIRCASVSCLLVFLFGLPWIFGLFASNIVAAYLFTLTATFQGFVLFIFFVVGNKKTRDLWLNKLKIKQTRKVPVTSSTYTNRSTGPGWRGVETPSTIEAKTSKPRSLTSPDESRFS